MKAKLLIPILTIAATILLFNCNTDNRKELEITKELLDSCKTSISYQAKLLNLLGKMNIPKAIDDNLKNNDAIHFNIDLNNPKPQVIHLSSAQNQVPFMIICKVKGEQIGDKFTFSELNLGVRSIQKEPETFFIIKGNPILKKSKDKKHDYILSTKIDIDTIKSSKNPTRRVIINSGCNTVEKRQVIGIDIDPSTLKKTLLKYHKNKNITYGKDIIEKLDDKCCGGVICLLNILM